MPEVFVTGMLRSGTTLVQVLLTNHPDLFVVYQPFHQLYVDVKTAFLRERGVERLLPLGDDLDTTPAETAAFQDWLLTRRFDQQEVEDLLRRAVSGKGGGVPELADRLRAGAGRFLEIREELHRQLASHFGHAATPVLGSKEILCEEYVPTLSVAGVTCALVVRDPRGVVASASRGRYESAVGDRYPLLMLVRLWRKSVRFADGARPNVHVVRYEDVATDPAAALRPLAGSLDVVPFAAPEPGQPLIDHTGSPWRGNSSFGSKATVDATSTEAWRETLRPEEARFVEACTLPEMRSLGYPTDMDEDEAVEVVAEFQEDEERVRASYLAAYRLEEGNRRYEQLRLRDPDTYRSVRA